MGKFALLIGVGKYQSSELQDLAAAIPDVRAIEKVLLDPAIADFAEADVRVLPNPDPQQMREAIERLFTDRKKDDLVLLYFSGHGVVDDFGTFHLTTARTENRILSSTAIPATFVHGLMERSRSQRQVVILDSCFSGAFAKEMKAKGGTVNPQLGGKGRAVLTSSSATEYSFEQKEGKLSVYTQYLEEGLRTGIADRDEDGWISIDELHEFAREKVREVAPAMQPKIYAVEEGYKIVFAKAPICDPKLVYRKEVEKLAEQKNGKLSEAILTALDVKQQQLQISDEIAKAILQEVLRPYQEFAEKLHKFQQSLQKTCSTGLQISQEAWDDLLYLQQTLGLTDQNVAYLVKGVKIVPISPSPLPEPKKEVPSQARRRFYSSSSQTPLEIISELKKEVPSQIRRRSYTQIASENISWNLTPLLALGIPIGAVLSIFLGLSQIKPREPIQSSIAVPSSIASTSPQTSSVESIKTAQDWFQQASKKSGNADYKGAIEDYTKAIELKPDFAEAYTNRGVCRSALVDYKGSIEDYNKAIELKPDFAVAYINRGISRKNLSDYKGAIDDYNKAIELKPNLAEAYMNRGNSRSNLSDDKGSIADYNKAIELKPDFAEAYYNRADSHKALSENDKAIADYQKAADIYQKQGETKDYQDALDQIKKLQ